MAGVELATAYVTLVPSAQGMQPAVAKEMGGAQVAAAAAGDKAGTGFVGGFSKATVAASAGLAVGGLLAKVGSDFDAAFDTIRVGTGATGQALEGLKADFREVARSVPSDFGTVGTAILGIVLFSESADVLRLLCIGMIAAGIVGLKLATPG